MKRKTYYLIPSRLESSRLPNKPLLDIEGLPMFAHVYFRTKLIDENAEVYLCTPNEEIIKQCETLDINYIQTSHSHVNGTERIAEAARLLGAENGDIIVNVQGDDPLVNPDDIQKLAKYHNNHDNVDVVIPHIVKTDPSNELSIEIVTNRKDKILYMSRSPIPSNYRKQLSFKKHLSIYSFRNDALQTFANTPETDIEKSEACEGLRALDIGMDVYTFALDNEYTPVDVIEQYEIVCKKMIDDKFLSLYSKKV